MSTSANARPAFVPFLLSMVSSMVARLRKLVLALAAPSVRSLGAMG